MDKAKCCVVLAFGCLAGCGSPAPPAAPAVLPADLVAVDNAGYAPLEGLAPASPEAQDSQRDYAGSTGLPLEVKTARTGIALRLIPPGSFRMGPHWAEEGRDDHEGPQRAVEIPSGLYVGKFEVTQGEWERVMGGNPAHFGTAGPDAPVEQVSWEDCREFLRKLCERERVPEGTYRLLTEAEWEYACRAGTRSPFCYGWDLGSTQANFHGGHPYGAGAKGEFRGATVRVGSFAPNAWGLYDMHGNVWEWVQDAWHESHDESSGEATPAREDSPSVSFRVLRGGCWRYGARVCRSSYRIWNDPGYRNSSVGLRLARRIPGED